MSHIEVLLICWNYLRNNNDSCRHRLFLSIERLSPQAQPLKGNDDGWKRAMAPGSLSGEHAIRQPP